MRIGRAHMPEEKTMSEENTNPQTDATTTAAAGALRDVPKDISEYKKFVAEGGHEHNAKILGREAAEAAAKAAGIVPETETGEQAQERKRRNRLPSYVAKLQRKIGERDAQIAALQKQIGAPAQNGTHAPAASNGAAVPAKAEEKTVQRAAGDEKKTPPEPLEKDFKTYGEYIREHTKWQIDRALEASEEKHNTNARKAEAETKNKAITDAHNARVDEAKTRYPDWDKAFKGLDDNSFTDPMVVFIFESDRGPDVTYYLATHRDELERIKKLSPLRQAAALGKIEDQFTADDAEEESEDEEEEGEHAAGGDKGKPPPKKKADEEPEPKPQTKRVSSAPPPAKPLGGKGGSDDPMPDPKDFAKYEAWSKRQAARGVKR